METELGSTAGSGRKASLKRIAYLALVGVLATFAFGMLAVTLIEGHGPSDSQPGRVLERISGETTVRNCVPGAGLRGCTERTYPTYTIIGERSDGTAWLTVGKAAYDRIRGGPLVVETSSVTGRVVGLETASNSGNSSWSTTSGGQYIAGWVVAFIAAGLILLWETARRSGRFVRGAFTARERWTFVPAVIAGMVIVWFAMFSRTWGLDPVTGGGDFEEFLADPFALVVDEIPRADSGPGGNNPMGELRSTGLTYVYIVPRDELAESARAAFDAVPSDTLAIPVVLEKAGAFEPKRFVMVKPGTDSSRSFPNGVARTVDCPAGLLRFEEPDQLSGFICFPASEQRNELQLLTGSTQFLDTNDVFSFEYPGRP